MDIIHSSVGPYIELTVAEHLYSLSLGEGWGEVCGLSFFKTDGHITGTESRSQTGRVVYCASEMAYSAGYFGDLVKQATGASAKEYIQLYIIRLAKNILMSGRSISETAYMLGFDYPHHFTRMFKNKTGITPGEYMRGHALIAHNSPYRSIQ